MKGKGLNVHTALIYLFLFIDTECICIWVHRQTEKDGWGGQTHVLPGREGVE